MEDAWVMLKVLLFLERIFIRIRHLREKQQRMYSKNVRNIFEAKFWIQHPPVFTKFKLCIYPDSKRCRVDGIGIAPKANLGCGVQGRRFWKELCAESILAHLDLTLKVQEVPDQLVRTLSDQGKARRGREADFLPMPEQGLSAWPLCSVQLEGDLSPPCDVHSYSSKQWVQRAVRKKRTTHLQGSNSDEREKNRNRQQSAKCGR